MGLRNSSLGLTNYQAATAGTTQTQAGATVITARNVVCTTGVANDGLALPRGDKPSHLDQDGIIVNNISANIVKVYPYKAAASSATDNTQEDASAYGGTVDGGAANAAYSQAASSTYKYILSAKNTWKQIKLS